MSGDSVVTAAVLVIGDEILSGRTKDSNIGLIAGHLTSIGIRLREVRVVPDAEPAIIDAINALRKRFDYVFTTGGIGPTHDDITADCVAHAFGVAIAVDPRAVALMRPWAEARGIELNDARLRMARIPAGATLIAHSIPAPPGFMMENVVVMAGIPEVMTAMLLAVTPRLVTGERLLSETIPVELHEGDIADVFAMHQEEHPEVVMGSYPIRQGESFRTELVLSATDHHSLADAVLKLRIKLKLCSC